MMNHSGQIMEVMKEKMTEMENRVVDNFEKEMEMSEFKKIEDELREKIALYE